MFLDLIVLQAVEIFELNRLKFNKMKFVIFFIIFTIIDLSWNRKLNYSELCE